MKRPNSRRRQRVGNEAGSTTHLHRQVVHDPQSGSTLHRGGTIILCFVDCEVIQGTEIVIEYGFAWIDTRNLKNLAPEPGAVGWLGEIDHLYYIGRRGVEGKDEESRGENGLSCPSLFFSFFWLYLAFYAFFFSPFRREEKTC